MAEFNMAVAGFSVAVQSLFDSTKAYCRDFLTDLPPQFSVAVKPQDLLAEQQYLNGEADREGLRRRVFGQPFLERNFLQRRIARLLLPQGVLLVHGSAVALDGRGYLFTAKCGTGKSTHARFWRETLGAVAVNDDKPFLKLTPEGVLLCGSPWMGKHGLGQNITVPLGGICLLQRGSENRIEPLHPDQAVPLLLPLCAQPEDAPLLSAIAQKTGLWQLQCTPSPDAARIAHAAMSP